MYKSIAELISASFLGIPQKLAHCYRNLQSGKGPELDALTFWVSLLAQYIVPAAGLGVANILYHSARRGSSVLKRKE